MEADTGSERPVLVFDVLGTLLDQSGSLEAHVSTIAGLDSGVAAAVVDAWLGYVAAEERAIVAGRRAFAPSHVLDREAVGRLVDDGSFPAGLAQVLTRASEHLNPWPDTVVGIETLSRFSTVLGLSNASRRVLAALSANAGMRWHQVLSAEDAGTYKPDPVLYRAALASSPVAADPPMMVAAHAWDLRAAAAAGMRTAYIPRPNGDAPLPDDDFDIVATSLEDFCAQLRR